jgi:Tol biopolymer transport system component
MRPLQSVRSGDSNVGWNVAVPEPGLRVRDGARFVNRTSAQGIITNVGAMRGQTGRARTAAAVALLVLLLAPSARAAVPAHGRAWELVTAGPTNGVRYFAARAWSPDGDRLVFATIGPMPGSPSGDLIASNLATRTPSGWIHQAVGAPISVSRPDLQPSGPVAMSADLSTWLWSSTQPLLSSAPPAPELSVYRRAADGSLSLLGGVGSSDAFRFVAASDNVAHAVFETTEHLLAADADRISGGDAYEFDGSTLRLVGVDTNGQAPTACGSQVGNGDAATSALTHAVSSNGRRIFFTAPASGDCGVPRRVYVRENGQQTFEVSASQCTRVDCDAAQDVTFAGASADGSVAFLVTAQQLTNDDTDSSADLYRYDSGDGSLTRLSAGPPGVDAGVSGPVRSSDDGELVFFVASGQLVAGQSSPGTSGLYLSDHGVLRFVAQGDGIDPRRVAASADGRVCAFATPMSLLPADADTSADVYRYDADSGALGLVSHGDGTHGDGAFDATFQVDEPVNTLEASGIRYMSIDGKRIFFLTAEPLVAEDGNTTADIYEWANGTVGLVSSGAGDATLRFGGVSADGRSVFFSTDESLLATDRNGGDEDVYAARLGGGFPPAPPSPAPCDGDACQGLVPGRLARPAPSSLSHVELSISAFGIRALDRRARMRLARGGRATIVVDVPAAGRVSLRAHARLHRQRALIAAAKATARGPAVVRLHLQLTAAARRALEQRGRLHLTLILRLSRYGSAPMVGVGLRRTR